MFYFFKNYNLSRPGVNLTRLRGDTPNDRRRKYRPFFQTGRLIEFVFQQSIEVRDLSPGYGIIYGVQIYHKSIRARAQC